MNEAELKDIGGRLERLEAETCALRRSSGFWKRACLSLLLLACALPFLGWKGSDKLQAESIRLVKDGKLRAMLSVTKRGTAALTVMDAQSDPKAILSVSAEGTPKFSFVKNGGKTLRMTLSATDSGNLALLLNNKEGKQRAGLIVTSSGEGSLILHDAAGGKK